MTTWITICDTCKHEDWAERNVTETDGERFAAMIETAAEGRESVKTRRHSCLMGCTRACNVAVQGAGKLNYTIGEFDVSQEAAQAVVDYAVLHSESESGAVPYRQWPLPIKGHFVTRHPPLPTDE
jgi:predicted metal-binding protein